MIELKIVTPQASLFEDSQVQSIQLPTSTGIITVYPNHEKLISTLVDGDILVVGQDYTREFAVTEGFVEVREESVVNVMALSK